MTFFSPALSPTNAGALAQPKPSRRRPRRTAFGDRRSKAIPQILRIRPRHAPLQTPSRAWRIADIQPFVNPLKTDRFDLIGDRSSLRNPWSHRLFVALCRRYGLKAYRYRRMRYTTVCVKAPRSFLDKVLWPEFLQLDAALTEHLTGITDRIIREEVYKDVGDADEVDEPLRIGSAPG